MFEIPAQEPDESDAAYLARLQAFRVDASLTLTRDERRRWSELEDHLYRRIEMINRLENRKARR